VDRECKVFDPSGGQGEGTFLDKLRLIGKIAGGVQIGTSIE
jgi:hypothetical protein